jgi:hypothetical protein
MLSEICVRVGKDAKTVSDELRILELAHIVEYKSAVGLYSLKPVDHSRY